MRSTLVILTLPAAIAVASLFACAGVLAINEPPPESPDGGESNASVAPTATGETPASGPAGTGLATGLPCEVQAILENRCIGCHGSAAVNDAGVAAAPLLQYDDLAVRSTRDPSKSRAQLAVELMKAKAMPPPPAEAPEADEVESFEAWLTAGLARNPAACTDRPPPAAGTDAGVGVDAGVRCTSGKLWTDGDKESPLMHPGAACNACHQRNDGPNLRIAGTVFPSLHEPNDCNGSAAPPQLTVVITDNRRQTIRLQVNAAGNFSTRQRVQPPFRATITDGTKTRTMTGSVTSGDCNSCHTTNGINGAPGRIMAP